MPKTHGRKRTREQKNRFLDKDDGKMNVPMPCLALTPLLIQNKRVMNHLKWKKFHTKKMDARKSKVGDQDVRPLL